MAQLPGDLPGYMQIGRASMGGPVTGGLMCIPLMIETDAIAAANTVGGACYLPFAFRVESAAWNTVRTTGTTVSVTADIDIMLQHNSSVAVGGTALFTAVVAVDAATDGFITREGGTTAARITATDADRTIAAGRYLVVEVDGDGADADWNGMVYVFGFPMTHIHSNPAND